MHTEWAQANEVYVKAATAAEHNASGHIDQPVTAPYALALSGDGEGALVIEGTRAELIAIAERIRIAVQALPDR